MDTSQYSKTQTDEIVALLLPYAPLIASMIVGFVSVLIVWKLFFSSSKGDTVLIVGPVNAGKTALFFRLRGGWMQETVTSIKENIQRFVPTGFEEKTSSPLRFVDFPGHGNKRAGLDAYTRSTRAVVFVVDGADKPKIVEAAQFLFNLLVAASLHSRAIPFLIAVNKSDLVGFMEIDEVKKRLESELTTIRDSQSSLTDIAGESGTASVVLGEPPKPFVFSQSRCPVDFAKISVTEPEIEGVEKFLENIFE
eukprot:40394_1